MNPETGETRELTDAEKKMSLAELLNIPIVPISDVVKQQLDAGIAVQNRAERRGSGWRCQCRYFNSKRDGRCQFCGEARP